MSQSAITTRWKGLARWQLEELDDVAEVLGITVQDLVTDHSVEMQNPRRWITPRGAAARSKGLEPPTFWLGAEEPTTCEVIDLRSYRSARVEDPAGVLVV